MLSAKNFMELLMGKWKSAFILGAVVGSVAALFMPRDKQETVKKKVSANAKKLKKVLVKTYDSDQVQQIFGKDSKEIHKVYQNVRAELSERLDTAGHAIGNINKAKYSKVVKEMIADLKEETALPTKQLNLLKKYLVEDYNKIKEAKS